MATRQDIYQQLASYRGILGWEAFTDAQGNNRPKVEVELYIKDHPIPIRKPKLTEINTVTNFHPYESRETNTQALFFGAPDTLQLAISGWIITPIVVSGTGYAFSPKDVSGSVLPYGNVSYAEVIGAYISGKLNLSAVGSYQRKDPDYYISPYGHQFLVPTISVWSPQYAVNMKRQAFSMTLLLEK